MVFGVNILGTKLLNSSFGLFHSDPFDIFEESGSTVPYFEFLTRQSTFIPESTGSWSNVTSRSNVNVEVSSPTSLTHSADDH